MAYFSLYMPPSFQAIYDQIWNLNFSSTLIVYRYYESLWLFMSFNLHSLRNGVIVCIYKSQTVVYGSLITDLGITDSTVVLGDLVQIICLNRAMVYKFSIFRLDI